MANNDWNSGEFAQACEARKKKKEINNVKALSCPMLPDTTKNTALFEGSQTTPACPSGKSNIMMTMSVEHWWNDTDRSAPCWEGGGDVFQYHFVHQKSHSDWPEIEIRPVR